MNNNHTLKFLNETFDLIKQAYQETRTAAGHCKVTEDLTTDADALILGDVLEKFGIMIKQQTRDVVKQKLKLSDTFKCYNTRTGDISTI